MDFGWIGQALTDGITGFFITLFNELINFMAGGLAETYQLALHLLDLTYVRNTILLAQTVAGSLIVIRILVQSLTTYILYQNGDSSANPKKLLLDSAFGIAMMASIPWVVKWVYSWGTNLAVDVANVINYNSGDIPAFNAFITVNLVHIIVVILAAVLWLLILFQSGVRSVEVSLLAVMGPFLVLGGKNDLFGRWWANLVVLSVTQAVQIFLVKGSMVAVSLVGAVIPGGGGNNAFFGTLMSVCFLWVAFKTPGILKEYSYSTGIGQAFGNAAQQAGSFALMRKAFTKV
ncbi:conjugal transfer protein TrbL family protein [Zhaonella formicivorans]|uniref:conjugal transfer protein TrbL family protein n=1 Tax=Zhaonella formicivorans TaxID=2528593 RepID=UPI0010EC6BEA|nr:conjugal transfer protein TrbL family protein [Zhaonella formicivorans]